MPKNKKGPPHIDLGTGKVRKDLRTARKEGKGAAGGQLGTISDRANRGINKQLAAADRRTSRILANMENISRQSGRFGRQQRKGIEAETAHQLSIGGGMSSGLTGSRSRSTKTATKAAASVTSALGKQGEKARAAEMQAIRSGKRSESQQDRASLSILDVLAAERKSEDVKFVQTMQHDEDMANFQAEQQIYMARLQARLQWKMSEKKAEAEGNKGQLYNFGVQMDGVEKGIQMATDVMADPDKLAIARLPITEGGVQMMSDEDAVALYVQSKIKETTPQDLEMSAINEAIVQTVNNAKAGELAPTWDDVSALIGGTSQAMNKYIRTEPRLKNLHDEYRDIRTQYRDTVSGIEEGGKPEPKPKGAKLSTTDTGSGIGSAISVGQAGLVGAAATAAGAALTATRAGVGAGVSPVGFMKAFLGQPGAFQGAVTNALTKVGVGDPFSGASGFNQAGRALNVLKGEAGVTSATVLMDLGLISAAGVVAHKLISDASTQFQFSEAAEDESLQSTFNMMDAYAESIIAGHRDVTDLDKMAADITESGDAGNIWGTSLSNLSEAVTGSSPGTVSGWTGPQKEMVANRLSVLRNYIQTVLDEQARANYISPIRGL